ncbi:MAG: T9SS type A sorting domain-containing protein [Ignavibacterium sp.]|nr:T9SS type A sorting domain-containing protein [Ignavibacterium sp.]
MKKLVITALMLFTTFSFAQQIPVTFSVDMGVAAFKGMFNPSSDQVVIRGDFQSDAGDPGGNWQGNLFAMTDPDGDTVYTLTVNFPSTTNGNNYQFKFVIAPDGWEGGSNRTFTVQSPSVVLPTYWFSNDSVYSIQVVNTINFTADISGILGIGVGGAFDPNQDSLLVMGLNWDGLGILISPESDRRMVNPFPGQPGKFITSLTVQGSLGDSTKWKFKAFPDSRFSNGGWETGEDRWITYQADGTVIDLPIIVPRIVPLMPPISNDVNIQFTVDMTNARNRYNNEPIPVDQIQFVGLRGGADFLGNWSSGCWCVSDTVTGLMKVLHRIPSTNNWTITVTAPAGTNGGAYEYKFAAMYPGADTVNGGSSPLDNEGGFGINHKFILFDAPGGLIVLNNVFGDFTTSVDQISDVVPAAYVLEQNYPNPFNPVTTIRYSLPKEGFVSLKVYNILGQEVVTLVNQEQTAGSYEVKFGAPNLSSGMYFYTLETNGISLTRKMMLVK